MRKIAHLLLFAGVMVSLASCQWLNPSIMFRTGKDYQYTQFKDSTKFVEYKISSNDAIEFQLYSNDGFRLIDLTTTSVPGAQINSGQSSLTYLVDKEGYVKLPILGRVSLLGLTMRQAEQFLEEKYLTYYNKPFAIVKVSNRRVILFPGQPGNARVIPLINNNITLLEALALAGGISQNGKAKRVKLIRGNLQNPSVYLIDLSTIDGIKRADLVLQANDIIYVEPRRNVSEQFLARITPVLSIITSTLIVYFLIARPSN